MKKNKLIRIDKPKEKDSIVVDYLIKDGFIKVKTETVDVKKPPF